MKIVTVSCDRYADTCRAFSELWRKAWPDCPHEIVFVTNSTKLDVAERVYYLRREDINFGWRLREFIARFYSDEHLLFMMSDYLVKSIDTKLVGLAHELCAQPRVRHVRLRPMPHPPFDYDVEGFGKIDKNKRYSLSLQPGIWETQVLYDLCRDNENPWETEIQGSIRAKLMPGVFLSTKTMAVSHVNYYRKGKVDNVKWIRENVSQENWPEACKE